MKKVIFAIFAHPDDEAFGPSGTLLMETKAGTELHIICLTAGESGTNPDDHEHLGAVRLHEWQTAGQLMGASGMHHLGYHDGELKNNDYHHITEDIQQIVDTVLSNASKDTVVEFMSNDTNGITGHIDHIVAARTALFCFCQTKQKDSRVTRMRLICLPKHSFPLRSCDWLYMEEGRSDREIGETIDARQYAPEVFEIIRAHHTQRGDGEFHISQRGKDVALNHFLVIE